MFASTEESNSKSCTNLDIRKHSESITSVCCFDSSERVVSLPIHSADAKITAKPEVILACVDNGKIIKFRMDLVIRKFREIKDKRIGRVLPPYITRIQQKCSQYIVREGTMPIPREIFDSFDE